MNFFMGIDGGGTNLRVVIIDANTKVHVEITRGSANPNLIGRETAALHIQSAMREALQHVPDVQAVGIGIAGASAEYASEWLHQTVKAVIPNRHIAAASDNEIALVGALGNPYGVLVLSGTGSGVFAMSDQGEKLQVGGWGYILGDEGSGYWIGLQALKHAIKVYDAGEKSQLSDAVLDILHVSSGRGLVEAIYLRENPVPRIASLAPMVLSLIDTDKVAANIVRNATDALFAQAKTAMQRLSMITPPIAFAGSLLSNETPVSYQLCSKLGLEQRPQALYRPVVGAALLAQLQLNTRS